jgi:hypothetical protein
LLSKVQYVCQQLVSAGYAQEGYDTRRGFFALTPSRGYPH